MVPFALLVFSMLADANNYTVLLRHGSMADCPCFRIPTLVATGSYSSYNVLHHLDVCKQHAIPSASAQR